jgi:hypothetical protein
VTVIVSSSIDWTNVIVSLIVGLPAIIAALYAGRVHHQIKTPSGKAIGRQVEDSLHTAISNNHHLQSLGTKVDAVTTQQESDGARRVAKLPENGVDGEPKGGA